MALAIVLLRQEKKIIKKRLTHSVLGFEQAAQVVDDAVHAGNLEVFVTFLRRRKKERHDMLHDMFLYLR